jgi:hypothetical protein
MMVQQLQMVMHQLMITPPPQPPQPLITPPITLPITPPQPRQLKEGEA